MTKVINPLDQSAIQKALGVCFVGEGRGETYGNSCFVRPFVASRYHYPKALLNNDWSRGLAETQTEYIKYKAIWDSYGAYLGYSGKYVFTVAFASTHFGDRKLGTTTYMIAGLSKTV